jgi:type I restriction enzyme R subunit
MPSSSFIPQPSSLTESVVEDATLDWFAELGYTVAHGPDLAPGEGASERATYGDVVLVDRLRAALARINPHVPADALDEALRRLLNVGHETPNLIENNRRWHQLLVDGVDVEYKRSDGTIAGDKVWPIDFEQIDRNDWLVLNQYTVIEDKRTGA